MPNPKRRHVLHATDDPRIHETRKKKGTKQSKHIPASSIQTHARPVTESNHLSPIMTEESATVPSLALTELISSFQKEGQKPSSLLPSAIQFYQIGLVLHDLEHRRNSVEVLGQSYRELVEQLPLPYLSNVIFTDLNTAFASIVNDSDDFKSAAPAIFSLCSLYANSSLACQAGFSIEICTAVATMHNQCVCKGLKSNQEDSDHDPSAIHYLLRGLSCLLLDGLLSSDSANRFVDEESHLQHVMEVVQALTTNEENTSLGDLQKWQQDNNPSSRTLQDSIRSCFGDASQREYLLEMLLSCPKSSDKVHKTRTTSNLRQQHAPSTKSSHSNITNKSITEIQRRIQQVREVLPDLGEGYIETALSCYQGDISETLAALLEGEANPSSLHATLQVTDKTLPARRQETSKSSSYSLDDNEAKRAIKKQLAAMERREEAEAYALSVIRSEYDDDYDDQYDGMDGGGTGGADVGFDVDLDTIKTFNQASRQAEKEDSFWKDMQNTNRKSGGKVDENTTSGDESGQRKFRGPDKGKGGRAIGPDGKYLPLQKGGKKAHQQKLNSSGDAKGEKTFNQPKNNLTGDGKGEKASNSESDNLTKIQKRRKNDNKSKLANHHRKERAQKKTGGF